MDKVSWDYATLYEHDVLSPPGRPVPTYVTPFKIHYGVLTDAEVEAAFRRLIFNRAERHT